MLVGWRVVLLGWEGGVGRMEGGVVMTEVMLLG